MDERALSDLQRRLSRLERECVRLRQGTMTGANAVALGGASTSFTGVAVNGHATNGDRVSVLTAGNDLLVLGAGSAAVSFSTYRSAALSLSSDGIVVFDAEEWDTDDYYSTATGRFTPQRAGIYRINAFVSKSASASIAWGPYLWKNGSSHKLLGQQLGVSGTLTPRAGGSALVEFNGSSDYVDIRINFTGGGSQALATGAVSTYFMGEFVGPS